VYRLSHNLTFVHSVKQDYVSIMIRNEVFAACGKSAIQHLGFTSNFLSLYFFFPRKTSSTYKTT